MVLVRRQPDDGGPRRDEAAEYERALDVAIAAYTDLGLEPTAHLLALKAQLKPAAVEPELEHKAEIPPVETVVPRRPGRPRKPVE